MDVYLFFMWVYGGIIIGKGHSRRSPPGSLWIEDESTKDSEDVIGGDNEYSRLDDIVREDDVDGKANAE